MKDILKNSYNKSAGRYDHFFSQLQYRKYEQVISRYLPVLQNAASILDLGCGTGLLAGYLASLGIDLYKVTGIDFSESMLAYAKKTGINCVLADIADLPFEQDCFDVVLSFTVLRLMDDPEEISLKSVKKVLKENGYFMVTLLAEKNDPAWHDALNRNNFFIIDAFRCGQDDAFICINKK